VARYKRIKVKSVITEPDEFLTFWDSAYLWMNENRNKVLIPLFAALLVVVSVAGFFYYRSERSIASQRELYFALKDFQDDEFLDQKESDPDKLNKRLDAIVSKYKGTYGAEMAELYKAAVFYEKGRLDDAETAYKKVEGDGRTDNLITRLGAIGLARVYQSNGKYEESSNALTRYRKSGQFKEEMDIITAENFELDGDFAMAREEYASFINNNPESARVGDVKEKLAVLATQ